MRKLVKAVLAVAVILTASNANAIECADPKTYVESVKNDALAIITSGAGDSEKRTKLDSLLRQTVDAGWMSKFVLGRNASKLTPEQQAEYAKVYEDYLSASYVDRFREYNGDEITINGVKALNSDSAVDTTINRKGKAPVNVTYRVRKAGSCYKITDIVAEGVSLINTQRQEFGGVFNSKGYEGFIEALKNKIASYSK